VLVNQVTGRARFNFTTLKIGILRALYRRDLILRKL
jgi:hypothetical protein